MALSAGVMTITVEFAKDVKDTEWFGRQDPYCVLRVGGQTFRTNTAVDAGRNPVWDETFTAELLNENDVEVEIMDANILEDNYIGHAAFSLARAREYGSDQIEVPVVSCRSGRQHGVLGVSLRWAPNTQPYGGYGHPVYGQQPAGYASSGYGAPPPPQAQPAGAYYLPPQQGPGGYYPPQQPTTVEYVEEEYRPHHHHHHHGRPVEEVIIVEEERY